MINAVLLASFVIEGADIAEICSEVLVAFNACATLGLHCLASQALHGRHIELVQIMSFLIFLLFGDKIQLNEYFRR